jgi:hypothetical protein
MFAREERKMSENNAKGSPTHEQVAVRAYEIFEERGSVAGDDVSQWLEAEQELSRAAEISAATELRDSRSKSEPRIVDSPISAPNVTGTRSRATVA